jgi:hypothetical protein
MLAAKKTGNTSKDCITSKSSLKKPKTAELKLTHYSNGGHHNLNTFKLLR